MYLSCSLETDACAPYLLCLIANVTHSHHNALDNWIRIALTALEVQGPTTSHGAAVQAGKSDVRQCEQMYKCPLKALELLREFEQRVALADHGANNGANSTNNAFGVSTQTLERVKRSLSTRGTIFGKPLRQPKDWKKQAVCRKCEAKRSVCFTVRQEMILLLVVLLSPNRFP